MPILLALLVGLLLAFQYFTLTKLAVEPAGAGLVSFAAFARNLTAQIEFSRLDIALGFALLTVIELLLYAPLFIAAAGQGCHAPERLIDLKLHYYVLVFNGSPITGDF